VIDQDQIVRWIEQQVSRVPVGVADEVVEHLHANDLSLKRQRIGRDDGLLHIPHPDVLHPHRRPSEVVLVTALDDRWNHVELQELVHLVCGDVRLVAVPVPEVPPVHLAECNRADRSAGREQHASGLRHAEFDRLLADNLRRPDVFLDLRVPAQPDLRARLLRRGRDGGQHTRRDQDP
jgi:hypothetical protein